MAVQERRRVLVRRYSLFERIVHWVVAVTFVYLMLSGLALFWPPSSGWPRSSAARL